MPSEGSTTVMTALSFTSKSVSKKKPHPSPTRRICLAFPSGSSIGDASAVSWIRTELSPKNRKQPPLCQNKPTYCNPNKNSGGSNNLDLWLFLLSSSAREEIFSNHKTKARIVNAWISEKSPDTSQDQKQGPPPRSTRQRTVPDKTTQQPGRPLQKGKRALLSSFTSSHRLNSNN